MNLQSPVSMGGRSLKMYASRLEKLGINTLEDFLFHLPSRYEDYSIISTIGEVQAGETVTIQGKITEIKNQYLRGRRIKTIQKAIVADETGQIELVWFNQPFLIKSLIEGSRVSVSGKIELSKKGLSISGPVYEILYDNQSNPIHTGRLIPVYPETKGISSKWLRRQIHNIFDQHEVEIREYLPDDLIQKNSFLDYKTSLKEIHFPSFLETAAKARERLSFDELFLIQLAANRRRNAWKEQNLITPFRVSEYRNNVEKLVSSLPFKLTDSQQKAINDILSDLGKNKPMNRLLQGDVGSGKTVVGAIAMYVTFINGFQSVFMTPTEILAQQHYQTIYKLLSPFGVKVEIRTGSKKGKALSVKGKERKTLTPYPLPLTPDILIGTHAVLSEKIKFKKLGFVVIDEQQRFGVAQRGIIRGKGENPHLLTMTATPIPRTVALTMYGDLDLSYLSEMPMGRKIIKTWLVPPEKRNPGYEWIRKQIKETDSQVFIICPFIEESESMQTIKAAKGEYERLSRDIFPDLKLGLLHGKLKSKEKDEVLSKFREKEFDILVATPVVEVGIDIPNATIMMIEASERFGLAQLHQLRGRVGRGDKQSYCLLFTDSEFAQNSKRLKGMETLNSGAELAELDLRLRGPGNMYGTAQHGIFKLKAASFGDTNLIQRAKNEADRIFPNLDKYVKLQEKVDTITLEKISPD